MIDTDKLTYEEQLKDDRWLDKRNEIIAHAGHRCEVCGETREILHVHHMVYRADTMAWEYETSELICLCRKCHEEFHKAVKWLSKEISELHPATLLTGLRRDPFKMADTIAEIAGRLAQLSWSTVKEIPL